MRTIALLLMLAGAASGADRPWPIVYVRSVVPAGRMSYLPATGANTLTEESDLLVIHPDGRIEELYDPGPGKAIIDPCPSLDAKWVYFSICGATVPNWQTSSEADIYKIEVATKKLVRLTHQEKEPLFGPWYRRRGEGSDAEAGVINAGPCPIPGGKLMFTSDREVPGRHQLWVMNEDGTGQEKVGYLNMSTALNPVLMADGRVLFTTFENQGLRNPTLLWGLWSMLPDGRGWQPEWSAFISDKAIKWHCEGRTASGERMIVTNVYYGIASSGAGTYFAAPPRGSSASGFTHQAPEGVYGGPWTNYAFFWPNGAKFLTPWASSEDSAAPITHGKVTHPSIAMPGFVLTSWTPGPVYAFARPEQLPPNGRYADFGIYLHPIDKPTAGPGEMVRVLDEPGVNEYFAKALAPASELFGREVPEHPFLPPATHPALKPGEAAGLVGSSGVYQRESKRVAHQSPSIHPFYLQGTDSGEFTNDEIHAIRFLSMEIPPSWPHSHRTALNLGETLRVLGEVPLRKTKDGKPIIDSAGNPDTSFLAKIPSDVPYTFQLIDKEGRVLTTSQSWHHIRPGEVRTDCRGCHAHTNPGIEFEGTEASKPSYTIADFTANHPESPDSWPRMVEFNRDVKPILQAAGCIDCHDGTQLQTPRIDFAAWGATGGGKYSGEQFRRELQPWVLPYQSRLSPLSHRIRGEHGLTQMPKGGTPLTDEQKRTIDLWIDSGCAVGAADTDHTKPSIAYAPGFVGAFDFSLKSLRVNGKEIATKNGIYPVSAGPLVIEAEDATGNVARLVRGQASEPPPPPPPDPPSEVDRLKAEVARLKEEVAALEIANAALKAKLARIHEESRP
jgi:hypothetical protein